MFQIFTFCCFLKCEMFIEDVFEDIYNNIEEGKENATFHNKLKNVGIFTFYSNTKSCIIKDLIEIDEDLDIQDFLETKDLYFCKNRVGGIRNLTMDNEDIRKYLRFVWKELEQGTITEIENISTVMDVYERGIFKAGNSILKKIPSQMIKIKKIKYLYYAVNYNYVLLVSNMMLDSDIMLIVFKALQTYSKTIQLKSEGFFNFMVLNFKNQESKIEFNLKIKEFYQNFYSKKEENQQYFISPFLVAEFNKDLALMANTQFAVIPDFVIGKLFDNDENRACFTKIQENLELKHFKKKNNYIISKRPGTIVKFYDNIEDSNKKECTIYNHIFKCSIKIICETYEEMSSIHNDARQIIKRVSKISIFCGEDLIQKINVICCYIYEDGKKKLLEISDNFENIPDTILLTEYLFQKFKENIFLFLKPGINPFYLDTSKNYDFFTSDFIFINQSRSYFQFKTKKKSIVTKYKDITWKLINFITERYDNYEIFYTDSINQLNVKFKNNFNQSDKVLHKSFTNVISFKKYKYENDFFLQKLENIDSIMILFENKKDNQNNIYIHFGLDPTIYQTFKVFYLKILKEKIEDSKDIDSYISQNRSSILDESNLKDLIIKFLNIFYDELEKCKDVYMFKKNITENINNMKIIELFVHKKIEGMGTQFFSDNFSLLKTISSYLYEVNSRVYKESLNDLDCIAEEIYLFITTSSSALQDFNDYTDLDRFIQNQK